MARQLKTLLPISGNIPQSILSDWVKTIVICYSACDSLNIRRNICVNIGICIHTKNSWKKIFNHNFGKFCDAFSNIFKVWFGYNMIVNFDLDYFLKVSSELNNRYKNLRTEDDLSQISDFDLLHACNRMGLITDHVFEVFKFINYMRIFNHNFGKFCNAFSNIFKVWFGYNTGAHIVK